MKFLSKTRAELLPVCLWLLAGILSSSAQTGTLRFSAASYSVKESAGFVTVTVNRSGGTAGTITGDYATVDSGGGTASAGADYEPAAGTLTFGPGVSRQTFQIPIVNDTMHENAETILVTLFFNDAFLEASVTLQDNDACVFSVSTNKVVFGAAAGTAPSLNVNATPGCEWTVQNNTPSATWLGISWAATIDGGEVVFSFDNNDSGVSRNATLLVAGKTVTVTQLPVPPPDTNAPVAVIRTPAVGARQTNDSLIVTGTASDNVAVTLVEARLENTEGVSDYIVADGLASWSVPLAGLLPGTNVIRVLVRDAANPPVEFTREVVFTEVSVIALSTNGIGSVTGLRDGQLLDVGKAYTVRAAMDRGHLFTGWSGTLATVENPLTFTMQTGFVLAANFVVHPYIAVAGSYNGLCHEAETNRHESSGFLTLKVTAVGGYSGRLTLGGARHSLSGQFSNDGYATNIITRTGLAPLTVVLNIDLTGGSDQILGSISDGEWTSGLRCDRATFSTANPASQAGRYTVILPGNDANAAQQPGGAGFGTVTVSAAGKVKLSATLADGTRLSQSAPLARDGNWPLYVPLYGGRGSVISWAGFAETEESDFAGLFSWFKPAITGARYYPAGFGVDLALSGSRYHAPTNNLDPILNFTEGRILFSAGNLAATFESALRLTNNVIVDLGTNHLSVSISRGTGLFSGRVTPPGTNASLTFRGALDQNRNQGWGHFLGTDQSGQVRLAE